MLQVMNVENICFLYLDKCSMLCHVFIMFHLTPCYLYCNLISGRSCVSFWDGNMGTQTECFQTHKADILCLCLAEDENSVYFAGKFSVAVLYTAMRRLTAGMHTGKCVIR
jgi:hypothetical protein